MTDSVKIDGDVLVADDANSFLSAFGLSKITDLPYTLAPDATISCLLYTSRCV